MMMTIHVHERGFVSIEPDTTTLDRHAMAMVLANTLGMLALRAATPDESASDATTATFNLGGTGIRGGRLGIVPEVSVSQAGQELSIKSLNGMGFSVELISLDGQRIERRLFM